MQHTNPFIYGNPVEPDQLIGRHKELHKIAGRINTGQSTIIVGSVCSGKTSVLRYLSSPKKYTELYGNQNKNLIFSYLDAHTFAPQVDQVRFWDEAFKPLQDCIDTSNDSALSELSKAYQTCQEKQFGNFEVEKLISQIKQMNWQLVLMIDEFDVLLHHPLLNRADFFGNLRNRFSLSNGALTVIIASNIPLSQLHEETRHFSSTGSPYFNAMQEIILAPLSEVDINKLLDQGKPWFTDTDRCFIKNIAGGHPYLLQVAASILWEIYENESINRQQLVRQKFYTQIADNTLKEMWQRWSEDTRQDFTAAVLKYLNQQQIALKQSVDFNKLQQIEIEKLMLPKEGKLLLDKLKRYGFVADDYSSKDWWGFPNIFLDLVIENKLREFSHKQADEKSNIIVSEDDELLKNLFTPIFLILMFMGTIFGERLGHLILTNYFDMSYTFSGTESLPVLLFKFVLAALGTFLGYQIAKRFKTKDFYSSK